MKHSKVESLDSYYENMIELMPGNVYWKDKDGILRGCNNNLAKILKLTSCKDIIGKTDYDISLKKDADKIKKIDLEVMTNGVEQINEECYTLPDGSLVTYLTQRSPILNKQGQVIGLIGTSFNITDRKKMEAELNIAKEKAEVANEAKSEFLRNMEHQLRTPFCGVYAMVEMLAKEETDSEKKQMLEVTYQSAKEFLDLLNNIIDFSRYQVDKTVVLAKKFDLKAVVEKAVTMEKAAATIKNIAITSTYPDIPTIFIGDENRVQRIVLNLLSNAIKFTPKGQVEVRVHLAKQIDEKHIIMKIIVSDTGIGIPLDKQQYIYEKFYRVHSANQNKYAGAGLGLHIVKELIDDLEGEIEVVSTPEKGSVFTCTLPLKRPLLDEV
ncbi:MAG: ATP-binding protein [Gammaproteobacteria bacterium]|nr:ATP-binding protein [Gammaproteobacteria bacterium]